MDRLRQSWNIYIFEDPESGMAVEALFASYGMIRSFAIFAADYSRMETRGVSALSAKPSAHMLSDREDGHCCFYNDEMTMSFIRRGKRHRLLLTAPFLTLPSGRTGLKADILFIEEEGGMGFDDSSNQMQSRIAGPMKAEGTIFIEHQRHDLHSGKGHIFSGCARIASPSSWSGAWASGDGIMLLISGNKGTIITDEGAIALDDAVLADGTLRDSGGIMNISYETAGTVRSTGRLIMPRLSVTHSSALFSGTVKLPSGRTILLSRIHGDIKNVQR